MDQHLRRHLHDTRLLTQLRELRERSARRARCVADQAREKASEAVRERQARATGLRGQREALSQACADLVTAGRWSWMPQARARREQLDEQIERADDALIEEEDELATALARLAAADQAWRRARGHVRATQALVDQARQNLARAREHAHEQEQADAASGSVTTGSGSFAIGGVR